MAPTKNQGVLLINLGTPDSPSVEDVKKYLKEFLMDPQVIDIPFPVRYAIVNFLIVPKRSFNSAEAYQKIWTPEGSPLLVYSKKILDSVRSKSPIPVELAMRYGNPSVEAALNSLLSSGVTELFLIPLFPQYAMSTFESAVKHVEKVARKMRANLKITIKEPFYNDRNFISALSESIRQHLDNSFDHIVFSFHGLPERHIKKTDPTKKHCLKSPDCCEFESPAHKFCYRHQCLQTTKLVVSELGLSKDQYSIAFQSRLGVDRWLEPSTSSVIENLPGKGVKKVLVVCPSFITDCIETLEEIGIRARESFKKAGGEELKLIPCLNDNSLWINVILEWIKSFLINADEKHAPEK